MHWCLIGAGLQKVWYLKNRRTLRQLRSNNPETRRLAANRLALSKDVRLHWSPKSQEEKVLFYIAQEDWWALKELAGEEKSRLAESEVFRRELFRVRDPQICARLIDICGLTASEAGADLILSAIGAVPMGSWNPRRPLQQIGSPGVPALIRALSSPNEDVRLPAIDVLGDLCDRRASERLAELLDSSSDAYERRQILLALARIGDNRARLPLLDIQRQGGGGLDLAEALLSLSESFAAADVLLSLLQDGFRDIEREMAERYLSVGTRFIRAAKLLSSIKIDDRGASRAFDLLLQALDADEWRKGEWRKGETDIGKAAMAALTPLWEARSFDELIEAAVNENPVVRRTALARLQEHTDERLPKVLPLLAELNASHERWASAISARQGLPEPEDGWLTESEHYEVGIDPLKRKIRELMGSVGANEPTPNEVGNRSGSQNDWPRTRVDPRLLCGDRTIGGTF